MNKITQRRVDRVLSRTKRNLRHVMKQAWNTLFIHESPMEHLMHLWAGLLVRKV